ncbi:enoyl-CoA hydratase [Aestuariibacter salexigens]|uniref:enoyl-CoA hydratase n=1 Tax=Aestuariibacter salexigens TaxID=226010 RepID=UPI00047E54A9|nr:enoyl-CoA hydratase [Aestuariibacter salexigens]
MKLVTVETHGRVMTITINRADKKNALTQDMYQQLAEGFEQAGEQSADIQVVVIKGAGDSFTAGNDISDFANQSDSGKVNDTARFMRALMNCPVPVIAEVQGMAVGIGTTLLLHCDFVYCASNTRFVLPFINLALVPEYASSYLLPKLAGHPKASEWLMLGEPFGPQDALQTGLVNKILEPEELSHYVKSIAQKLCDKPRMALLQTKALLKYEQQRVQLHMDDELDVFIDAMQSPQAQEAFSAFIEKRAVNREIYK